MMEGHRIPDKIEPINREWFNEGCITERIPEYIKDMTFEDLRKEKHNAKKI